ncbi:response regulator [Pseudomonas sp. 1912-s]|uniref:response regulator n=1 Tax=Pseudomonas sp. 1912-s TaxID=3033802 RepID=UPI0023DE9771|nr:response regulator [Pseudomonas sp. 1912-s]MDF3201798.1 response regulator [Pseudomonas sp. 1912-s]
MSTPSLRILIVDPKHWRRLCIEKMLNHLSYYRIAPVESFEEFLLIVENSVLPFDLVLINSVLPINARFNMDDLFQHSTNIRHVLVYEGQPAEAKMVAGRFSSKVIQSLSSMPDDEIIKRLMNLVDPPRKDSVRRSFAY